MDASTKSGLNVISVGDFKIDEIGKDKGILCKLTVITKPEANIQGYKGIEVKKQPVTVTAEDVDREIDRVRERNSRMVTVEDRAAENGDVAEIDFDGYVDGKQFDGGKAENYDLTLGAGQFIPGFEEQVVGHKAGEEFDVNVTFPEDYHAEELKGKPAVFKIKLHEIKKKELPEVDDEFVKDVSEFDTLDEYKKDLEEKLRSQRQKAADADVENQLVEAIIEKVEATIPDEMVENEVDEIINSFAYRLQSQGLKLETYLKYTGQTTDDLRVQYKPLGRAPGEGAAGSGEDRRAGEHPDHRGGDRGRVQAPGRGLRHARGQREEPGVRRGHQRRPEEPEGHRPGAGERCHHRGRRGGQGGEEGHEEGRLQEEGGGRRGPREAQAQDREERRSQGRRGAPGLNPGALE